ncbi:hypothetical protein HHK36_017878 [Tetracentron sinense]|uniref:Uncharacterized protein n=1 Tax=Tetracentron sinense TaxID=13715 RepID=A0A834Z197_TETSI|nr:hypothetical protein HHK36_017878 [Tetracentron sinense]
MASATPISQSQPLLNQNPIKTRRVRTTFISVSLKNSNFQSGVLRRKCFLQRSSHGTVDMPFNTVVVSATTAEKPKKRYPGEAKGFVEEMRFVAMKLHTKRIKRKKGRRNLRDNLWRNGSRRLKGYSKYAWMANSVMDSIKLLEALASRRTAEFGYSCGGA